MQKININFKNIKLNKTIILIMVSIFTLIIFIGGTTYAYFANNMADPTQKNMEIMSNTVDNLFFEIEKDIQINANINNFTQGKENLSDDTDATATLIPNNYNNQAIAMYNVYIIIEENDLEYTTENQTPELLLNVTDPNGNKLENITGLIHYDNGFDITTRTGGFLIASDYIIEASNVAKVQTWNLEITLVNLDSNQNANLSKRFSAKIYLTQEKMSSYIPIQITNMNVSPTYNSVYTTLNISNGTAKAEKYYFGIEEVNTTIGYVNQQKVIRLNNNIIASAATVEYYESDNPNYEFKNLKANTRYIIYSYVVDENGIRSNIYQTEIVTNEYRLATISNIETTSTINSITITVNASGGDGTIEKYKYSKDNGQTWVESISNTYTFSDLNDTTEYKIKVKVTDSNGYESLEYYKAVATETYILPVIANVETTTTYNSITLTPSGTNGTGAITKYLYSINGGSYQESNTFNGLNEQTEYTIRVKAIDENGRESNPVYELKVTTDTYEVPVINNVTTSSTTDSITINVSGSNGDGTITTYYYSRDNGSNWYESTYNTYTFSSLTSNTTFYIKVKVKDSNGRESAEYSTSEKTKYINPVVNSVSTSNITTSSITLSVSASGGTNSVTTYYYSKDNGSSYVSSTSNTYTFSGLTSNTTYNFKVYVMDNGGINSEPYSLAKSTLITLANYIKNQYTSQGTNGLYYHTSSLANSAADNSYRYAGANPNNYVCFGSTASTCPSNNLYRIIGVFGSEVKLIQSDYYGKELLGTNGEYNSTAQSSRYASTYKGSLTEFPAFGWDATNQLNTWSSTTLNTINLNQNYINNLGSNWSNKIATHTWKVGGMAWATGEASNAKQTYNEEVGSSSSSTTYSAKIGLMYLSDYYYGATNTYWTYPGSNISSSPGYNPSITVNYGNAFNYNWLALGIYEWTISKVIGNYGYSLVFGIDDDGTVRANVSFSVLVIIDWILS